MYGNAKPAVNGLARRRIRRFWRKSKRSCTSSAGRRSNPFCQRRGRNRSLHIVRLTNQIHQLLDSRDVDPDELLPLILECAQEKYSQSRLASNPKEDKIRALLAQHADDEELDPNFFHQVIKGVVLMERCTIRLRLWNGLEF